MLAILSANFETMGRRTPNSEHIRDIDESDACMKFERNPLKKLLCVKEFHRTVAILSAILEIVSHRTPNSDPVINIHET